MKKTYKREVALALLVTLVPAFFLGGVPLVETLVWPIFGFATAAFGLDSIGKQVMNQ